MVTQTPASRLRLAFIRDDRGTAALEFAAVAMILVTILGNTVDFGVYEYYRTTQVQEAAQVGAQTAWSHCGRRSAQFASGKSDKRPRLPGRGTRGRTGYRNPVVRPSRQRGLSSRPRAPAGSGYRRRRPAEGPATRRIVRPPDAGHRDRAPSRAGRKRPRLPIRSRR